MQEEIDLYDRLGIERREGSVGKLTVYRRTQKGDLGPKRRPGILIVPGGGYNYCSAREEEPVALRFLAEGYAAFVLEYAVKTAYPLPLLEGAMAMVYLRRNAERYGFDENRLAAIGFSAGGHLAGMLSTLFREPFLKDALGEDAGLVRPDASVLCYPVLTTGRFTERDTAQNISGGDEALKKALSLETRVTKESSPVFLWHTTEDDLVPAENSLLYASACRREGVPFELHLFERGRHGVSVCGRETETDERYADSLAGLGVWFDLALEWLRGRGFEVRCA